MVSVKWMVYLVGKNWLECVPRNVLSLFITWWKGLRKCVKLKFFAVSALPPPNLRSCSKQNTLSSSRDVTGSYSQLLHSGTLWQPIRAPARAPESRKRAMLHPSNSSSSSPTRKSRQTCTIQFTSTKPLPLL